MDKVSKLLAIEEIKALKARYFRMVDTNNADGYANVFTPDGVMDLRFINDAQNKSIQTFEDGLLPGDNVCNGREAIREAFLKTKDTFVSVHHGFTPEIEIDSETEAHGTWAMEDRLWDPTSFNVILHGFGYYEERYRKIDTGWAIAYSRLTRTFLFTD